ncbi:hypothetical protein OSTOST_13721 [Ostertagia ostertagi]
MHTYMKLFLLLGAISLIMIAQLILIRCLRKRREAQMTSDSESPPPQAPQHAREPKPGPSPKHGATKGKGNFLGIFKKHSQPSKNQRKRESKSKESSSTATTNLSAEPTDETTGSAMYAPRGEARPSKESGSAEPIATPGSNEPVESYPEPEPFYYRYPRRRPQEKKYVKGWEWM